jgi:predicted secreted Zn-dependent protease
MPAVIPDPVIHETVAYYDIAARTEPEIVKELNAKGPTGADGKINWGMTQWSAGWDLRTRQVGNGHCIVDRADLSLNILIVLPRWTPAADVPPTVVEKWKRMSSALERHEQEHATHGREAIAAVASLMRSDRHADSCKALRRAVEKEGRALMQRGGALDKELDRTTNHGATEGVGIQW